MIDLELEGQVIATMLYYPDCLNYGLAEIKKDDFSDSLHKHIFDVIRQMYDKDETVNAVTVYEKIKEVAKSNNQRWLYLRDNYIPSSGTFDFYVKRLKQLTKSRSLMKLAQDIVNGVNNKQDIEELSAKVETEIYEISANTAADPILTPKEQAERILETVAKRMDETTRNNASIYTSFKQLNFMTGGFDGGDLVIISGPTGGGKTTLAQNFIRDISIVQRLPSLHINTEMSQQQIDLRWSAMLSRDWSVNNTTLRAGAITQEQFSVLASDMDAMYKSELYSITIPDLTVPKMLSTIRRFVMQKKIRALVVDYIGRIDTMNSNKDDWKQLLSAAKKLKTISQQFGLVTFMIAQNNSEGNLAMAGYMEHEADCHLHVRPMSEKEAGEYGQRGETWWNYILAIKKGRSSRTGNIPVRFAGEKLTFLMDEMEAKKHAYLVNQQYKQNQNNAVNESKSTTDYYVSGKRANDRQKPYSD